MDDIAARNQKYWDSAAKTYDTLPWQQRLRDQVTDDLRANADWIHPDREPKEDAKGEWKPLDYKQTKCRLLDYACGPGMLSHALAPYITSATGIDISSAMVDEYNSRASSTNPSFHAIAGDLCSLQGVPDDLRDNPDLYELDMAGITLGFHHFEHRQLCLSRLAERLRPGGVLMVVDFVDSMEDDLQHDVMKKAAHTVAHKHGFSQEEVKRMFAEAGCEGFEWIVFASKVTMGEGGKEKSVFLARGVRDPA